MADETSQPGSQPPAPETEPTGASSGDGAGDGPQTTTADDSATSGTVERRRHRGPDLTDDALRAIIKDAAKQTRTGHLRPRRDLPLTLHPRLVKSKEAAAASGGLKGPKIEGGFALRKVPVERAAKAPMKIASWLFIGQWLMGVLAGILYAHFQPGREEQGQFITLLLSSLTTFTCAVVAFIELNKLTRAGRSVAIGLALVNALAYGLLAVYARHWVMVVAHVLFAIGIAIFLSPSEKRKRSGQTVPESSGLAPPDPAAPLVSETSGDGDADPSRRRRSLYVGLALVAASWLMLLVPAVLYRMLSNQAPIQLGDALTLHDAGSPDAPGAASRAVFTHGTLVIMSGLIGEKASERGALIARHGLAIALAGDAEAGYERVVEAYWYNRYYGPIPEVYYYKARVYCLRNGLLWRPHSERMLTEAEINAIQQPRPGQINTWLEEYWVRHGRLPSDGWVDPLEGELDDPDDAGTYRPPSWAARNRNQNAPDGNGEDND